MRSRTCKKSMKEIVLLVSGDLPEDRRGPLEAHLASCARCARELAAYQRLVGLCKETPLSRTTPLDGAAVASRVMERLRPKPVPQAWVPRWSWVGALCLLVIAFLAGAFLSKGRPLHLERALMRAGAGQVALEPWEKALSALPEEDVTLLIENTVHPPAWQGQTHLSACLNAEDVPADEDIAFFMEGLFAPEEDLPLEGEVFPLSGGLSPWLLEDLQSLSEEEWQTFCDELSLLTT